VSSLLYRASRGRALPKSYSLNQRLARRSLPMPLCIDCKETRVHMRLAKRCTRCRLEHGRREALLYYHQVRRIREGRKVGHRWHECLPDAEGNCVRCGSPVTT
jgi:hypothetical protein